MKNSRHDRDISFFLDDVHRHTGHGILFYDREERNFRVKGALPPFCRCCLEDAWLSERCRDVYEEASRNALLTGEPFHYTCWAGLMLAAVALAPFTRCIGCAAIGGFRAASEAGSQANFSDATGGLIPPKKARIAGLLAEAPPISSTQLRGLGAYLQDAGFASGLNSAGYFRRRHEIYLQQRAIAEVSHKLGAAAISPSALVRRANGLIAGLARADGERRRRLCAHYLAMVLHASKWDMVRLKAHLRVPLALLARDAILRGEAWTDAARLERRFMERLDQAGTIEDVCYLFHEILVDCALHATQPAGLRPPVSERVVRWLESNYHKSVTLEGASLAVGASAPSIIKHIKRDTGKTFHALLLEIRISEAKRFLASAVHDLSSIAQQCGFYDQSHFTRHFRKATNLTPGQFRRLMTISEKDILEP